MSANNTEQKYTMGRSEEETQRLMAQSQLFEAVTQRFITASGVKKGMKVLDLGSGAGDVALAIAKIVGPEGQVVGVDMNPEILKTATSRAEAAGHKNVKFMAGDAREIQLDNDFDALIGRLVLMYIPQPEEVLKSLKTKLKPGGIVAFQEVQMSLYRAVKKPETPLMNQMVDWCLETFKRSGANEGMGLDLHKTFVNAGLPQPSMHLETPIGSHESWAGYPYFMASFQSLLPLMVEFGITTHEEVGMDTLEARMKEEVKQSKQPLMLPPLIYAHTQLPN